MIDAQTLYKQTQTVRHTHTHKQGQTKTISHNRTLKIAILLQFLPMEHHFVLRQPNVKNCNFVFFSCRSNIISCERVATDGVNSQFYLSFWRSNLISCERVANERQKLQFYRSFCRSNLISCERVAEGHPEIAILPQFLTIGPHFVRKGCNRTSKIAILS